MVMNDILLEENEELTEDIFIESIITDSRAGLDYIIDGKDDDPYLGSEYDIELTPEEELEAQSQDPADLVDSDEDTDYIDYITSEDINAEKANSEVNEDIQAEMEHPLDESFIDNFIKKIKSAREDAKERAAKNKEEKIKLVKRRKEILNNCTDDELRKIVEYNDEAQYAALTKNTFAAYGYLDIIDKYAVIAKEILKERKNKDKGAKTEAAYLIDESEKYTISAKYVIDTYGDKINSLVKEVSGYINNAYKKVYKSGYTTIPFNKVINGEDAKNLSYICGVVDHILTQEEDNKIYDILTKTPLTKYWWNNNNVVIIGTYTHSEKKTTEVGFSIHAEDFVKMITKSSVKEEFSLDYINEPKLNKVIESVITEAANLIVKHGLKENVTLYHPRIIMNNLRNNLDKINENSDNFGFAFMEMNSAMDEIPEFNRFSEDLKNAIDEYTVMNIGENTYYGLTFNDDSKIYNDDISSIVEEQHLSYNQAITLNALTNSSRNLLEFTFVQENNVEIGKFIEKIKKIIDGYIHKYLGHKFGCSNFNHIYDTLENKNGKVYLDFAEIIPEYKNEDKTKENIDLMMEAIDEDKELCNLCDVRSSNAYNTFIITIVVSEKKLLDYVNPKKEPDHHKDDDEDKKEEPKKKEVHKWDTDYTGEDDEDDYDDDEDNLEESLIKKNPMLSMFIESSEPKKDTKEHLISSKIDDDKLKHAIDEVRKAVLDTCTEVNKSLQKNGLMGVTLTVPNTTEMFNTIVNKTHPWYSSVLNFNKTKKNKLVCTLVDINLGRKYDEDSVNKLFKSVALKFESNKIISQYCSIIRFIDFTDSKSGNRIIMTGKFKYKPIKSDEQ